MSGKSIGRTVGRATAAQILGVLGNCVPPRQRARIEAEIEEDHLRREILEKRQKAMVLFSEPDGGALSHAVI